MAFWQGCMLVTYQDWKIWQSYPVTITFHCIYYGEDLLFVVSLVKFTLDLLLSEVHLERHWPITPNSALLVLSLLELDSKFGFWPLEKERVFQFGRVWDLVRTILDWLLTAFIHNQQQEHFLSAFFLLHQIREWLHWSRVFKGPCWPQLPQEHGLSLGEHYAAVWGDSAQDGGQRSPTDQEQRPPTKTLL